MSDLEQRLERLERRVRELEDELALQRLMTRYGPAVDSGSADAAADLHTQECIYDSDGRSPMIGARGVAEMISGPKHQAMMPNTAHTMGPAIVKLDGDRAEATGYSRVYLREGDQFRPWRVSANHWEFERRSDGWKISGRQNRLIGTPDGSKLLRQVFE